MIAATVLPTYVLGSAHVDTITVAILYLGVIAVHVVYVTRLWVRGDSASRENPNAMPISYGLVAGILATGSGPIALSHWLDARRARQMQH